MGDKQVQILSSPAQGIQADQHVVTDGNIDGAQVTGIELKRLSIKGVGHKGCHGTCLGAAYFPPNRLVRLNGF